MYRPPSCTTCESMQLFDYVDELLSKYPTVTVMGDFNVSELDWSSGLRVFRYESNVLIDQHLINTLDSFKLQQQVTEPTRENNFFDLMFTSVDCISHMTVLPCVHKCNHDMVLCKLSFANVKASNCESLGGYRSYNKPDYDSLAFVLEYVDWSYTFCGCVIPDDYWFAFKNVILYLISSYVPLHNSCGKCSSRDKGHMCLRQMKNDIWRKWNLSPTSENKARFNIASWALKYEVLKRKSAYEDCVIAYTLYNLRVS